MNHAEQDEPLHEPSSPEMPDRLDVLLRQNAGEVEDRDFTKAVLSALPRRQPPWLRPLILLGASAFGLILGCLWLSWKSVRLVPAQALHPLNLESLTPWLLLAGIVFPLLLAIAEAVPVWKTEGDTTQ